MFAASQGVSQTCKMEDAHGLGTETSVRIELQVGLRVLPLHPLHGNEGFVQSVCSCIHQSWGCSPRIVMVSRPWAHALASASLPSAQEHAREDSKENPQHGS